MWFINNFIFKKDCETIHVYMLSHVWLFVTPWTISTRLLCHRISQARVVEWVAISSNRWSSWPRDQTRASCVSCTEQADSLPTAPPGPTSLIKAHMLISTYKYLSGKTRLGWRSNNVLSLRLPTLSIRIRWIRTAVLIKHLRDIFGEGNGTPLQDSCLESPMDGGAWWAAVHGVAKSQTRLSNFTFTFHFHALEKEMATHSSTLARRIPGTGEPGGLPSMGSQRVRHDWGDLAAAAAAAAMCLRKWKVLD